MPDYLSDDRLSILNFVGNFRFDLQLFAAEDEGRTEEPTEHKKRKAREEGQVAKSQELVGIIVFLLTFWTVALMAKMIFKGLADIMNFYISNLLNISLSRDNLVHLYTQILYMIAKIVLPVMGVGLGAAIGANVLQSGFLFTTKKITFNFGKLFSNIGPNLKKMFISVDTLFNTLKSLLKVAGVFAIAFIIVNARLGEIINMPNTSITQALSLIANLIFQFVSFSGVLLLVLALGDYMFQRWQFTQSLKMSKQELKEEYKEMEGNPEIKAKIRELERRLLSRKMINEVPKADVVITNPTHIAVAIKYDPNFMNAPSVVAKGEGTFAQRIKEVAKENNVYVIENKPLAREIYYKVDVGQEIPADLFFAVAKVLSLVYQMKSSVSAA
jgi:flagellar biosynthetic protein FlhB